MLVTCPTCSARYRLAEDRLPPQGARVRCPKCEDVFTARPPEEPAVPPAVIQPAAGPSVEASGLEPFPGPEPFVSEPSRAIRRGHRPVVGGSRTSTPVSQSGGDRTAHGESSDPFYSPQPPAAEAQPPAVVAARIRLASLGRGERPLLVSHGFGLGAGAPGDQGSEPAGAPSDALLALSSADMAAIAEDLVCAFTASHPDLVALARGDGLWEAHLGSAIREAWSDYQSCVGSAPQGDDHFREALNRILAAGRPTF